MSLWLLLTRCLTMLMPPMLSYLSGWSTILLLGADFDSLLILLAFTPIFCLEFFISLFVLITWSKLSSLWGFLWNNFLSAETEGVDFSSSFFSIGALTSAWGFDALLTPLLPPTISSSRSLFLYGYLGCFLSIVAVDFGWLGSAAFCGVLIASSLTFVGDGFEGYLLLCCDRLSFSLEILESLSTSGLEYFVNPIFDSGFLTGDFHTRSNSPTAYDNWIDWELLGGAF